MNSYALLMILIMSNISHMIIGMSCVHPVITPAGYLCPMEANTYDIRFTYFQLEDMDSHTVMFDVTVPAEMDLAEALQDLIPDASRFVRYRFPSEILRLKNIGAR